MYVQIRLTRTYLQVLRSRFLCHYIFLIGGIVMVNLLRFQKSSGIDAKRALGIGVRLVND